VNLTQAFKPLQSDAATMGVNLTDKQCQMLLRYAELLLLWNKKFNLTAITEPHEVYTKHVLDCLSVLPKLGSGSLIDVGTGAGLPGLIIAIAEPDREILLLDKNAKRIRFLLQCISEFKLTQVRAEHNRIEDVSERFDIVTSRAFTSLVGFCELCQGVLSDTGQLMAMKGSVPLDEIAQLEADYQIETHKLAIPGLNAERSLVALKPR